MSLCLQHKGLFATTMNAYHVTCYLRCRWKDCTQIGTKPGSQTMTAERIVMMKGELGALSMLPS